MDMNLGTLESERITLIKEQLGIQFAIDDRFSNANIDIRHHFSEMTQAAVYSMTKWFYSRELKEDYYFKHPKDLWNLLKHFTIGKWNWGKKYVEWTEYKISVKEAYNNISMPDKHPFMIVQKFKNGKDVLE